MSSTAIVHVRFVHHLSNMLCSSLIRKHLAQACWAADSSAVLLRTGDACNLEDSVDDTTDTFASNETSGNGVAWFIG